MKKRQFLRAKKKFQGVQEMNMNKKALVTISHAQKGEEYFDKIGSFIFFSTISGQGWLLDPRENLALRLADNYEALPYKIMESKTKFHVEWKEEFFVKNGSFYAISFDGHQSIFYDYPCPKIKELIRS